MTDNQNCVIVSHEDGSVSFIPRECVLYITEWFDENRSIEDTMMNCRIILKNNQGYVLGKYNRKLFSPLDFFNKPDTAEVLK
jgi:hypothetical protein